MRCRWMLGALVALAIGAAPAAAQGIMVGWVNATADLTEDGTDVETGSRNGFTAGIVFGKQSGLIGFRSEALYTQKGFAVSDNATNAAEVRTAYIDVPIMLKVDALIVRAYVGPQASFRVACTVDGSASAVPFSESCSDEVEFFDFGFKGGVGAKILIVTVDVVATAGTRNFASQNRDTVNAKNRTFSIVLGLAMP